MIRQRGRATRRRRLCRSRVVPQAVGRCGSERWRGDRPQPRGTSRVPVPAADLGRPV